MTDKLKIATLVGSLRREAFSRRLAGAAMALAPANVECAIVEIGELAFYNEDLDAAPPPAWTTFRERIGAADAALFVTPEHNRSVPAPIKNAVDVGSRPRGKSVWIGRPVGIISCSPGAIGGFGANHHLRQMLTAVGAKAMGHPEAYIGGVDKLLGPGATIANESTRDFIAKFMTALAAWIRANPKT